MNKEVLAAENSKQVDELCEDMEVVGPGLMLSDARKKLSLSIEEVSKRLNFRPSLVEEIEQDIFDQSLPATFNRGYLRNYAKLVSVDISEVMSAYDMLGVAQVQRSEMQSFSNLTEKQAEHSRLMWFSYLIAAILFGLMVLWWLQEPKLSVNLFNQPEQEQSVNSQVDTTVEGNTEVNVAQKNTAAPKLASVEINNQDDTVKVVESEQETFATTIAEQTDNAVIEESVAATTKLEPTIEPEVNAEIVPDVSTAVFTFSGDCWVNIHDATGERIAWGVKKSGYVMTISGKAPLKVTLGRPELATINFNDKPIDMTSFNAGNIAKFTLPLTSQ